MPVISFKAKVQTMYHPDDTEAYKFVKLPKITRSHCDMSSFRSDQNFRSYANSDLLLKLVEKSMSRLGLGEIIRLDNLPNGISVDTEGFLYKVSITIGNWR